MTTRNEAAERLHFFFSLQPGNPKQPHNDLDEALTAAKTEGAREAVAEIWQQFSADAPTLRDFSVWLAKKWHATLGERESSLGRDAEGRLSLSLGPGAESPSRKGEWDVYDGSPQPDVITGRANLGAGDEPSWSELDGLSPLEQYNREGR